MKKLALLATSVAERMGFTSVANLAGGMAKIKANGVPIISSIDTSAPFIFEFSNESDRIIPFSYDTPTLLMQNYPIDRKIGFSSILAFSNASSLHGNQFTGL